MHCVVLVIGAFRVAVSGWGFPGATKDIVGVGEWKKLFHPGQVAFKGSRPSK